MRTKNTKIIFFIAICALIYSTENTCHITCADSSCILPNDDSQCTQCDNYLRLQNLPASTNLGYCKMKIPNYQLIQTINANTVLGSSYLKTIKFNDVVYSYSTNNLLTVAPAVFDSLLNFNFNALTNDTA
jgi:hypothetical protein